MIVNAYPIDPAEFEAWLLAQVPRASVGLAWHDAACPLARFLAAQFAGSLFLVHATTYERVMDDMSLGADLFDEVVPLPAWACRFVRLVDGDVCVELPVSREVALTCLAAVCGVPAGQGEG